MSIASPYTLDTEMRNAGWTKDFDISDGGFLCVKLDDAPSLGSATGKLFTGRFTKDDGTRVTIDSNMDRSMTTVVLDPMGNVTHTAKHNTLIEAEAFVLSLNIL
jgi:hypothetical protein